MPIPLSTISSFRASFSPFSPLSKPCRLILSLLQTPTTAPVSSASHIQVSVTKLPRNSPQLPEMTIGFRNGKELKLEVGKNRMKIDDILEELGRVGRVIEREETHDDINESIRTCQEAIESIKIFQPEDKDTAI
ncbi:hypothetical protein PRK78_005456 [Emydomyces testavorans]|uniref:Large ribosomal subunit protein mL53 n=1 Tax=Emydomyces testavorans TaxID=2070801 RepID=A0AAF0DKK8_9EURO|nr:hypothetical protein PRK78_005456 [Emydomyces testavorans]